MSINATKIDEESVETSKTKTMLRLFSYLLQYKKQIIIVLLIMAFCVLVSIINPIFIEIAIDDYITPGNIRGLVILCVIALIINFIMIIMIKARTMIMSKMCNHILVTIREQLYTHIQTLDFKFFDSRPTGKVLARIIGDINSLKDVLSDSVTTLLPDFITVCAVIVIMVIKNPTLALASFLSTPLMALGTFIIQVTSHKRWQINRKKASNVNAFVHEDKIGRASCRERV